MQHARAYRPSLPTANTHRRPHARPLRQPPRTPAATSIFARCWRAQPSSHWRNARRRGATHCARRRSMSSARNAPHIARTWRLPKCFHTRSARRYRRSTRRAQQARCVCRACARRAQHAKATVEHVHPPLLQAQVHAPRSAVLGPECCCKTSTAPLHAVPPRRQHIRRALHANNIGHRALEHTDQVVRGLEPLAAR